MTQDDQKIHEAAFALVSKLESIHEDPRFRAVWVTAQFHIGPYTGPKYEKELAALKNAMNTPNQNPQPRGWVATNKELQASNEMAAEHMERGREYATRLESQLDRLKNAISDHRSAKYEFADAEDQALYAELDALDAKLDAQ